MSVSVFADSESSAFGRKFSLEGQLSGYTYEEPSVMKLKGNKLAVAGRVERERESGQLAAIEGRLAGGEVDYTSNGSGEMGGIPDSMVEARGLIGKRTHTAGGIFTPYVGLGFRNLVNNSAGMITNTGYYGYKRVSTYFYLPLGIDGHRALADNRYVEFNVELDILLRGRQQSYLAGETVTNTQTKGRGFRAGFLIGQGRWAAGPFISTWNIAKSDEVFSDKVSCDNPPSNTNCYWHEPKNKTVEGGLRVRYSFE